MNVCLCRDDACYTAGESISVSWRIGRVDPLSIENIELSILWHTLGKGDEDLAVHHFERAMPTGDGHFTWDNQPGFKVDVRENQSFSCRLPESPLSYHGRTIQLVWCIRMRLKLTGRDDIVTDLPFHLIGHQSNELTKTYRDRLENGAAVAQNRMSITSHS